MSAHEVVMAFEFTYATLSGDATLMSLAPGGIWRGFAPPDTATPFVVMAFQAATDTLTMNAVRIMTIPLLQIKVVGPASEMATIAQASVEIDNVLKRTSGSATGGLILAYYRDAPLFQDEIVNGEQWTNIGGLYRMQVQQTS